MITEEILLQNKYKKFNSVWEERSHKNTYISSYQKRFDNDVGKKYFITLNLHDFSQYRQEPEDKYSWSIDTQFYIPKGDEYHDDETFNVDYFVYGDTTIEMIELFYEKLWNNMGCRHYEKWDEC